jgi:hypothetical protein
MVASLTTTRRARNRRELKASRARDVTDAGARVALGYFSCVSYETQGQLSLQTTADLLAVHAYLPQVPHAPPGVPLNTPHPPQAFRPGSEQLTELSSAVQT